MFKKLVCILLFGFLIIGAASAANDFKINDGFNEINEYYSVNDENGMILYIWEYDDDLIRDSYLQNDTDYEIVSGDNNTYNITYNYHGTLAAVKEKANDGNATMDHGILEIAEIDGEKYIFMTYLEEGSDKDWKLCHDELMKFNENNGIEPLADAI